MTACKDCEGGAERCATEGHLRSVDFTTYGQTDRRYYCKRCRETFIVAGCANCGASCE